MWSGVGSNLVPTQPHATRRIDDRFIGFPRIRGELRRTAAGCDGVGRDYESVALPLSYPGVTDTYERHERFYTALRDLGGHRSGAIQLEMLERLAIFASLTETRRQS